MKGISKEDVLKIAYDLKIVTTDKMISFVLARLEGEAESDPSGDWTLWVEKLLYEYEEEDEIDLFEFYEELPQNIQDILLEFGETMDNDEERKMLKVLEPLGYTFEVGMDGCAYGLRELREDEK